MYTKYRMDYDTIKAMTYDDLAEQIQTYEPPLPSYLHYKWESAKIMNAIGQWKKFNWWMCEAYVRYKEDDDAFWQQQFTEAYKALELSEQPHTQEMIIDLKPKAMRQLIIANRLGRITREEMNDILSNGKLRGNELYYWVCWKTMMQEINNLTDAEAEHWWIMNRPQRSDV